MATYVTRVVLTREVESPDNDITAMPGREIWRVSWTQSEHGRPGADFSHTHYTPRAAHTHARNLLDRRPPGTSIEDVYSEDIGG